MKELLSTQLSLLTDIIAQEPEMAVLVVFIMLIVLVVILQSSGHSFTGVRVKGDVNISVGNDRKRRK